MSNNLPNCKFCHQNNYRDGDSYVGTHTEKFYYCQTEKCLGTIQYFYCYRPFCLMFWRVVDSRGYFRNTQESIDWVNEVIRKLRSSNGAKITTIIPYCLVFTKENDSWNQVSINETVEF